MAHRSRLSVILIDCPPDRMDAGVEFWSGALGMRAQHWGNDDDPYAILDGRVGGLTFGLQAVNDEARIHLDIESDDVDAEVRRLEVLGARRKEQVKSWWVMEAPSGHVFCVVGPQSDDVPADANLWES